jgi:two-component system, LuxR family, sensor kinase FixL
MPEKSLLQQSIDKEPLSQSTLANEQMRSLYHSLPVSLLSSIIIALILSISHWPIIGQAEIILWNLLLGCTLLGRLILWIFWHNAHQLYPVRFWLNSFRIGVWLTGSAWGATAVLLFAPEDTIYQALLAFSLAGVASGSITSLTVDKYSSIGFVILAISPLSIIIFIEDGPTAIAMTSMTLLFIFFVIASTTRARLNMEDQLNKNFHLLKITNKLNQKQKLEKIINNAQSIYIGDGDITSALSTLLKETLSLCHSELGFIGQVTKDAEQNTFMRALVFGSDKKEDWALEKFRAANLPENGEYRNLDNLFGMILRSEKPIISSNFARDMRASTLPPGHPAINNFIGIPIFNGQEKIAILGLANSPLGYTNQTAEELEPILKSIAQLIQTMNHEQQHAKDKAALEASSQHTQTILNDIADGIITLSKDGIIQSFNHAAETIFGYKAKHIIGSNISTLMTEPHKSLHDEYLKSYLKTGKKNILGIGREVIGLRRNGDEFPMDLMVSRVFQHDEPLFIGIVRDITEKRRVDGLHSQFIAAASKEILGPLNVITEAINLLKNDASTHLLPEPLHHAVSIVQNNSVKLQKLMSDLIEVHNLSKGDASYKLKTQMVYPLIEKTLHRNQAYIDIYQCRASITATEKSLTVHIDSARLTQALTHLLQYSLKLAVPKSEIGIRINEDRNRVKIAIGIAGKRLSEDEHNSLLSYFGINHKPTNQEPYAEGDLGLAIAKEIIEKMHGKIYIEQKGEEYYFIIEFLQAAKEI